MAYYMKELLRQLWEQPNKRKRGERETSNGGCLKTGWGPDRTDDVVYRWGPSRDGHSIYPAFRDGKLTTFEPQDYR